MRKVIFVLTGILIAFCYSEANAQSADSANYIKHSTKEREVVPYPYLREADAHFVRRIQRIMDTREKQNLATRWPRNALSDIVYEAAIEGKIEVYEDEQLTVVMDPGSVQENFSIEELIPIQPDPNDPYYTIDSLVEYEMEARDDIYRYRIMEEWIFDKQQSVFFPRIIAIAPLFRPEAEGQRLSEQPLFWARFTDLQQILINEPMFNRHNDAMQLSYFDFFEMRLFSSYIIKEPNEYDLRIAQFDEFDGDPFRALLESERIRNELFNEEHDLWEY